MLLLLFITTDCPFLCSRTSETGPSIHWQTRAVTYRLPPESTAEQREAIQAAFAAWTSVAGTRFSATPADDSTNLITFKPNPDGVIAPVTVSFDPASGLIVQADIAIGNVSADTDLQTVMTHAVGHFLGFANNHCDEQSVMNPVYEAGSIRRALSASDAEGMAFVYPATSDDAVYCGEPPTYEEVTIRAVPRGCQQTPVSAWLFVVLAIALTACGSSRAPSIADLHFVGQLLEGSRVVVLSMRYKADAPIAAIEVASGKSNVVSVAADALTVENDEITFSVSLQAERRADLDVVLIDETGARSSPARIALAIDPAE